MVLKPLGTAGRALPEHLNLRHIQNNIMPAITERTLRFSIVSIEVGQTAVLVKGLTLQLAIRQSMRALSLRLVQRANPRSRTAKRVGSSEVRRSGFSGWGGYYPRNGKLILVTLL